MAKDFRKFEIEDFAFDETFQNWVLVPKSEFSDFWEQYVSSHPLQTDKILAARTLVLELKNNERIHGDHELADSIWLNIQHRIHPKRRWLPSLGSQWQWAASVAFLLGVAAFSGWLYLSQTQAHFPAVASQTIPGELLEEVNRTTRIIKIHLSDGSVVSLGKDSRLSYPKKFDAAQRLVSLSGEAYFEVQKNPDRPFLVYTNETVTKVLGTSFRVKAYYDAPDVTVQVRTGRVSVFSKKDFEDKSTKAQRIGVVLTPNQQAVFLKNQLQLSKSLVAVPELLMPASRKPSFDFNNTPLQSVFDRLQLAYGVEIVADAELTAHRTLTVSMEDETLYEKLDVICLTLGLSYQVVDAKVIIESRKR